MPAWPNVPRAPQWGSSEVVSTQLPAHSVRPPLQPHVPLTHVSPAGHATPQVPQLSSSVFVSTQLPAQTVPLHSQSPEMQVKPEPQALLHEPQWTSLVARLTHEEPQTDLGAAQVQVEAAQVKPLPHDLPQLPQLLELVVRSTQELEHWVFGA